VLVAVIAVQHYAQGGDRADQHPTTGLSVTPPDSSTSSPRSTSSEPNTASQASAPDRHRGTSSQTRSGASSRRQTGRTGSPSGSPGAAGRTRSPTTASTRSSPTPSTSRAPQTTFVSPAGLVGDRHWELVGLAAGDVRGTIAPTVIRYQPASGDLTTTGLPQGLASDGRVAFVVTRDAAVIRPFDIADGYLVQDGERARKLTGLLARGVGAWPGPDGKDVWVYTPSQGHPRLTLVSEHGKKTGTAIAVPSMIEASGGSYVMRADGAGMVFAQGVGGTYALTPDGVELVTHARVVATGPTVLITYDCNSSARCATHVVNRSSGKSHRAKGLLSTIAPYWSGITSPNGHFAVLVSQSGGTSSFLFANLATAHAYRLSISVAGASGHFGVTGAFAFTPDSRYLLVATDDGVLTVDTATGKRVGMLPVPPLAAIAVRPVPQAPNSTPTEDQ
jgi:hypothetical protein